MPLLAGRLGEKTGEFEAPQSMFLSVRASGLLQLFHFYKRIVKVTAFAHITQTI
jgi:hypothetical protein